MTSAMLAASAIPVLVVGPFAGVFVDRLNPRTIRLAATILSAFSIFALSVTSLDAFESSLAFQLVAIVATVAVASAVAQFLSPAAAVMTRDIVPAADLGVAAGASQAVSNLNLLLAPVLAAVLFAAFGPFIGMIINALSFVAAAVLVVLVRNRAEWDAHGTAGSTRKYWEEFREGVHQFRRFPVLRVIVAALMVLMIGAGMLNGLDVFFARDNLSASDREFGLIFSAQGAGMLIGSLVAPWLMSRRPVRDLIWIGLVGMGVVLLVYARLTSVIAAIGAIGVLGIFIAMLTVSVGPVMMATIPREFIGRVSALLNPILNLGNLAGLAIGGVSYSLLIGTFDREIGIVRVRPIDTIFTVSALLTVSAGIWTMYAMRGVGVEEPELGGQIREVQLKKL
jgi:MFS family permease